MSERHQRKVDTIYAALPKDKPQEFYEGMLLGYKQAVVTMYGGVDPFVTENDHWTTTTLTALGIERKFRETK